MKQALLICCLALLSLTQGYAQGARNIKINEVLTNNRSGLIDEYGQRLPWVELANTSYSTYNVRGMYITTDKGVLDKGLSVYKRVKMMSLVPSNDPRTELKGRQHVVFFLNSSPERGALHLTAKTNKDTPTWLALYDANGTDLIDSVSIPALKPDMSYARYSDGSGNWCLRAGESVTPDTENFVKADENKILKWKRNDPHGFVITILSMGIVFSCLTLLYVFFRLFGTYMEQKYRIKAATEKHPYLMKLLKAGKKVAKTTHKTTVLIKEGLQTKGNDKEIYIAVISMALHEYLNDLHDTESGIITIKLKDTRWKNS